MDKVTLQLDKQDTRILYKILRDLKDRRQVNIAIGLEYTLDRITKELIEKVWVE